jgi:hypothetical protein
MLLQNVGGGSAVMQMVHIVKIIIIAFDIPFP